jgi:hypothetical protein
MAGNPRKRAKLQAQQAEIERLRALSGVAAPENAGVESLPQRAAHAPARTRVQPTAAPLPRTQTGRQTIAALDQREAEDMRALQAQLSPRARVRIFRERPTWAAGWVEDFSLRTGSVGELLEYLRDEHGGQDYRIEVLARDGQAILYETDLPIAGMVRRRGKPCTRDQWEGIEEPKVSTATVAPAHPSGGMDALAMFDRLLGVQEAAAKATSQLVDKMHTNTMDLVESALEQRTQRVATTSPTSQLRELVTLKRELDEVHAELGGDKEPAAAPAKDDDDIFKSVAKDVMKDAFLSQKGKGGVPAGMRRVTLRRKPQADATTTPATTAAAPNTTTPAAANGGVERIARRTQPAAQSNTIQ